MSRSIHAQFVLHIQLGFIGQCRKWSWLLNHLCSVRYSTFNINRFGTFWSNCWTSFPVNYYCTLSLEKATPVSSAVSLKFLFYRMWLWRWIIRCSYFCWRAYWLPYHSYYKWLCVWRQRGIYSINHTCFVKYSPYTRKRG